jgi:lysophospholipase L1-like esterase
MEKVIDKADLDDGLHPNAQGHQKIAEKIWKEISPL